MSALARLCGVPPATIKHYLREGLLPAPAARTGRNMAWYDPAVVRRIEVIKELQRTRFLPLRVIKDVLEGRTNDSLDATRAAIESTLSRLGSGERRSRADLVASGVAADDLVWLESLGVLTASEDGSYGPDDLALLRTLGDARRAGIDAGMLPVTILAPYVHAIQQLVRVELRMFREGVLARATGDVTALTEAATVLSERLVVLLRRKMLLPMLAELQRPAAPHRTRAAARSRAPRKKGKRRSS